MRIGIDIRYLSHGLVGGVHTYVANFVPALLEQAHEHEVVLYADTKRPVELHALPPNARIRRLPYRNALSSMVNDFGLRRAMRQDRIDVAHFPANYGFGPANARTVVTLHDAINVMPWREIVRGHSKRPRTIATMTYLHLASTAALRRADLVLTVSNWAADDIARHTGVPRERIVPIPHGPTPGIALVQDPGVLADVRRRHALPEAFVLADALKNPGVLVRAWHALPAELKAGRRIVFFSRREAPAAVQQAVAAGDAVLLPRPSREDLAALYSMADAFVFPSWIEGFGIPVLEAMTCGAAVIASNRGAIPEVLGGAGLLADAEDDIALAAHLRRVLGSEAERKQLRQQGWERAAQFSWRGTALSILDSYRHACASSTAIATAG